MSANVSKHPQPPFTQVMSLSGDRVGSKGRFRFAGFAWISDAKVIFVQGDMQNLETPPEWRQLLRLINLAHRLRRSIVLWNLPIIHIATKQRRMSLAKAQVIQRVELALLKLPHPIIAVFDETCDGVYPLSEACWNDGIVLVSSLGAQLSESGKVKMARHPAEIAPAIVYLLCQAAAIPAAELIEDRSASLHMFVKSRTAFSSELLS